MAYEKALATAGKFLWTAVYRDIQFLREVVIHPQVVIAYKEENRQSTIAKLSELAQYTVQNRGEPPSCTRTKKSKRSPKKKQRPRIGLDSIQPMHKAGLALPTLLIGRCA